MEIGQHFQGLHGNKISRNSFEDNNISLKEMMAISLGKDESVISAFQV